MNPTLCRVMTGYKKTPEITTTSDVAFRIPNTVLPHVDIYLIFAVQFVYPFILVNLYLMLRIVLKS